jgi:diguanylate cyclase (GGDEF)-like protein/PAS domain S-box-containing protein
MSAFSTNRRDHRLSLSAGGRVSEHAGELDHRLLSVLLDASADAIYGVDGNGRCVFANDKAAEIFGYTLDEFVGCDLHAVIHHSRPDGSALAAADCAIHQALVAGQATAAGEEVFWRRDGSPVWATYGIVFAHDAGDGVTAVVRIRDVTDQIHTADALKLSRTQLSMTFEAAGIFAFEVDLETGRSTTSTNCAAMLGLPAGKPVTYDEFRDCVHPDDRPRVDVEGAKSLPVDQLCLCEYRVLLPTGEQRWFRSRVRVVEGALGRSRRLLGVAVDITDREEAQRTHRRVLELSTDAFVGMDAFGVITEWNSAAEAMFGVRREKALGRELAAIAIPERYRAAHRASVERVGQSVPKDVTKAPLEFTALRADGTEFPVEVSMSIIATVKGHAFRAFIRDISSRRELEAELQRSAVTDQLTGLPNSALLRDRLAGAVQRLERGELPLAVMFVDVDRIKAANDSLGHRGGDELLTLIAARLDETVRAADTVARFGGDEFAIVCEGITEVEASAMAGRVLAAFEKPFPLTGGDFIATISMGIVLTADPSVDPDKLVGDAEVAMYRAKDRGRNRAETFDEAMGVRSLARLDMETGLRAALERGELRLDFQPIVDVATGEVTSAEALVRWHHPVRGVVAPLDFIPLAEETRLIVPIGKWILEEACRHLATWTAAGHTTLTIAVNISGLQLTQPNFVATVARALGDAGVDANRLCLEITETVLMEDTDAAEVVLGQLNQLGVRIAIDDFGTGYSSLLYVRRFPVDALKLDRCFVSGLGRDEADTTIVRATIDLAHALGIEAVAEGVERPEELRLLESMDCDLAQGFFWSKPVAGAAMPALLARMREAATVTVG